MNAHQNARTTPHIRELMAARFDAGWPPGEIAAAVGVSVRTNGLSAIAGAALGLAQHCFRAHPDRQSLGRSDDHGAVAVRTPSHGRRDRKAAQIEALDGCWLAALARDRGRLHLLQEKLPVVRYEERERAGELIHFDIKKLGRFNRIGHRITGKRAPGNRRRGWDFVHVAVDDTTRLAYVEVLPDEGEESAAAFLERALR